MSLRMAHDIAFKLYSIKISQLINIKDNKFDFIIRQRVSGSLLRRLLYAIGYEGRED